MQDLRKMAYETAVKNNLRMPDAWVSKEIAGKKWTFVSMKRHPRLSLQNPEACSLSRAIAFNKHNVNTFIDTLNTAMMRNPSFEDGSRVFNLDETGLTTVQSPKRGHALPPAMVFPRVHLKEHMLLRAPRGTIGLANPSGWMNSSLFVSVMEHFIRETCSTKENPTLLNMDNHESHISLDVINLAREDGVTIFTMPFMTFQGASI
ncbi:hypothetical protein ILUMI_21235 [Ignelater luminosus]|uniref:DDE-1 domain-containing protein n=1 Tax=Ignelater luminosus TaxID=2038154 RepID=A0A8K0CI67_IGNLU|nr:hypothetical protein ILUMI_21235 [Ignelater luminosus]